MRNNVAVIILAAGMGTRMKSDKAKVLHEIQGRPMILYVVETATKIAGDDVVVVIGNQAEEVRAIISDTAESYFCLPGTTTRHRACGFVCLAANSRAL